MAGLSGSGATSRERGPGNKKKLEGPSELRHLGELQA
jgi:hypothetical protein